MDRSDPTRALARLEALVGEWTERVAIPDTPVGRATFEWALGGQFLIQRSEIQDPEIPDSVSVIAVDQTGEAYTQHYFDSRGVVRIYAMTLTERSWTLVRTEPDFTPLNFCQRFTATIAEDGDTIDGAWETSADGVHWELDFNLTFTKSRSA